MSASKKGQCGRCGICLSVCPVYKVLMEEHISPRARIQMIEAHTEGRLPSSKVLKELVNKCLMCGSCVAHCPSGVDHPSMFMHMREELSKEHGDRIEIRSMVYLLAKEQRLKHAASLANRAQKIIPGSLKKKCTLGTIPADRIPELNKKPFRSTLERTMEPKGAIRGTVVYFTGCATNFIFEKVGQATVGLLTRMGYRVVIPKEQTCCSIPMLYHGAVDQAQKNVEKNVACLLVPEADFILVDCPTCGSALQKEYPLLAERYGLDAQRVQELAQKVVDVVSFLRDHAGLPELQSAEHPVAVTYHAPCHLKNVFGSSSESVLEQVQELDYRPSGDARECCGGGGTFCYEYPEVSAKMSLAKAANARKTGAQYWLTDCPVCRINLEGQLEDEDRLQLLHPVEVLYALS